MKKVTLFMCFLLKIFAEEFHSVFSPSGEIKGFVENVTFDGTMFKVRKYLGIPYAESPIETSRFKKPVPRKPFKSTYEATELRAMCVQAGEVSLPRNDFLESEDCLFLNVYTPHTEHDHSDAKPVIVYIHGGYVVYSFVNGGSNLVSGDVLSAVSDVIVVTFNYRLSLLGFFSMDTHAIDGNFGLWDQQLAISWVHRNIKAFGGDPKSVTLFGDNQGALSALLQSFYPGNAGHFQRIIAHNGTPFRTLQHGLSLYITETYPVIRTLKKLGCLYEDVSVTVNCMKNISITNIKEFVASETDNEAVTPSIDIEFILARAEHMVNDNETLRGFSDIDLLIGFEKGLDASYLTQDVDENSITYHNIEENFNFESFIHDMMLRIYGYGLPEFTEEIISNRYRGIDQSKGTDHASISMFASDTSLLLPVINTYLSHKQIRTGSSTFLYETQSPTSTSTTNNKLFDKTPTLSVHERFYMFGFSSDMLAAHNMSQFKPKQTDIQISKEFINFFMTFVKHGTPFLKVEAKTNRPNDSSTTIPCILLPSGEIKEYGDHPSVTFWLDIVPRLIDLTLPRSPMDYGGHKFEPPDADDDDSEKDISKKGANAVIISLGVITGLLCLCLVAMAVFVVFVKIRRARVEARGVKQ